jgi:class 3 adenylate cyclase
MGGRCNQWSISVSAVRVPRSFAFVDLSGFTNYTDTNGDEAAAEILARFRAITRELASDHGVRIAKWLGDGCMVVSVERTYLIGFALDLRSKATAACSPLGVRMGVASGFALLFEGDDYIGSAVNLAARLCDAAAPGEILLPAELAEALPDGVIADPHLPLELHGIPGPTEVITIRGEPPTRTRHDTGELWTRSPFVA